MRASRSGINIIQNAVLHTDLGSAWYSSEKNGGVLLSFFEWIGANWELVGICFGILVNALGLAYNVYKLCRSGKVKALQHAVVLAEAAREYEQEAEQFEGYGAAEKLHYVLSRLQTLSAELGCQYDEEKMIRMVESDIAFTKCVNAKQGDRLE